MGLFSGIVKIAKKVVKGASSFFDTSLGGGILSAGLGLLDKPQKQKFE